MVSPSWVHCPSISVNTFTYPVWEFDPSGPETTPISLPIARMSPKKLANEMLIPKRSVFVSVPAPMCCPTWTKLPSLLSNSETSKTRTVPPSSEPYAGTTSLVPLDDRATLSPVLSLRSPTISFPNCCHSSSSIRYTLIDPVISNSAPYNAIDPITRVSQLYEISTLRPDRLWMFVPFTMFPYCSHAPDSLILNTRTYPFVRELGDPMAMQCPPPEREIL